MGSGCSMTMGSVQDKEAGRRNAEIEKAIKNEIIQNKRGVKLLLLGAGESGKSTVVKQMRIIHMEGFNHDDYIRYRGLVQGNVVTSMATILKAMKHFGIGFDNPDREYDKDLVMETELAMDDSVGIPLKVMEACRDLWGDSGIQQCYSRSSEYQLWDCAKFFLTDLNRIGTDDYLPDDLDILRVRVRTSGISEVQFNFKKLTFRLFDVGGQRSERKKWIHCFDDVFAIIFCVALSEYDQMLFEDETTNRMYESIRLFEAICNNSYFFATPIILFLNKTDLFRDKITHTSITCAFPNYEGAQEYEEASDYIRDEFKAVNRNSQREIYVHKTCATDTENIKFVFDAVSDVIIALNLNKAGLTD